MHVFLTGGSGQTGPAVVTELLAAGHTVTGLARSERSATRLHELGAGAVRGSLDDLDVLTAGAAAADGVVHLAFGGDFADRGALAERDRRAIEALGAPLVGTGRPLVVTSGTLVMAAGRTAHEQDPPDPGSVAAFRLVGEQACLDLARRGVRAVVLRLAPTVHGPRDHGFVPVFVAAARRHGVVAHPGDGSNRWPAVHRRDAARLYRLALESAPAGAVLHGVGEEAVRIGDLATRVGRGLGLPTAALPPQAFAEHLGSPFLATVFALDVPASSAATRDLLGWSPQEPGLLADLADGDYLDAEAAVSTGNHWSPAR